MISNPVAVASPFALLWPSFALAALVLASWAALLVRELRCDPPQRDERTGAEMLLLYFALVPLLLMFRQVTIAQLILAYFFVILRALHGLAQIGKRDPRFRARFDIASAAVLTAMWIGFFVDTISASRLYAIRESVVAQL